MPDAIPEVFSDGMFVLLRDGIKFPPSQKEWQMPENYHSFAKAKQHQGNVGIVPYNGYIGLDQDDPEAFKGLKLNATTAWETRPGRLGMRFACDDHTSDVLDKHGFEPDQAQIFLNKNGEHVGEIKLERTYQVIPPSWKTIYYVDGLEVNRATYYKAALTSRTSERVNYKMIDSIAPTKISLDWLLSELKRIGITFSKSEEEPTPKIKAKLETNQNPDDRTKALSDVENDLRIRPCLKETILDTNVNHCDHQLRLAIVDELIVAGYSDEAIHGFFSRMSDYDERTTGYQINKTLSFIKKGGRGWKCETLKGNGVVPRDRCKGCRRPEIKIVGDLPKTVNEILDALTLNNDPPRLYQRAHKICRLKNAPLEEFRIEELDAYAVQYEMASAADFKRPTKGDWIDCEPPLKYSFSVMSMDKWDLPPLTGITRSPVMRPDGSVLSAPGYDSITGLYYQPSAGLVVPDIPNAPTKEAAIEAGKFILDELLPNFPFLDDASKANAAARYLRRLSGP